MSSHLAVAKRTTFNSFFGRMPAINHADDRHESSNAGAEDNETPANNPPANKKMKLTRAERKADDDYDWDFAAQCFGDNSVNAERCLRSRGKLTLRGTLSTPSGFHIGSRGIPEKIRKSTQCRRSVGGKAPRKQKE